VPASAPREPAPPLPTTLPGRRRDVSTAVGDALRAAIGDLDGDGRNEIVVADAARLRVLDPTGRERASVAAPAGIQVLIVADVDGDGHAEIVAGWGQARGHLDALASVVVYRLRGGALVAEPVLQPTTSRAEITALVPGRDATGPSLLIAYFESKYLVRSVLARPGAAGAWAVTDVATLRTATAYARADVDGDGQLDLIVGRVYGDAKGVDGDAFVLRPDGRRIAIATTRGVRELAAIDTDGDGRAEVYLADGWHQNYAQSARGLLTRATFGGDAFQSELVEDTAGQSSVGRILGADVDGDGRPELVTVGSNYVRMFRATASGWVGTTLAGLARDVAVGDLDGVAGAEVLILGTPSEIVSLAAAPR
jgi:hypothetical protein